jgi:glycerophosphoryl diester phosphodiesterase
MLKQSVVSTTLDIQSVKATLSFIVQLIRQVPMHQQDLKWLTKRPIAHRGFHNKYNGIVENCTQAFEKAIAHDFSIELDVQITSDGKAAVFHDYSLDRLTNGSGRVDEHSLAALSSIAFKHGSDRITELSDLLVQVAGKVALIVELKTPKVADGRLEKAVADAVHGYDGPLALMSFSPAIVQNLIPMTKRPRGIVSCNYFRDEIGHDLSDENRYQATHLLHAKHSQPNFISYCIEDFPTPSVDVFKTVYDMPSICWTTKSAESHIHALKYCDQVTFEGYNPDEVT